ncbi:MAG: hypothetical protein HQM11_07865 [SAR324 cluster bacterium]|nr:hypothetical protein [SAR324 cluster bacterium]
MKWAHRDWVRVDILNYPEHVPVRGNYIKSGDESYDKECEDRVMEEMEWNDWAWCTVQVTVKFDVLTRSATLGCCSYKDKDEFKASGYYEGMVDECISTINQDIVRLCTEEMTMEDI